MIKTTSLINLYEYKDRNYSYCLMRQLSESDCSECENNCTVSDYAPEDSLNNKIESMRSLTNEKTIELNNSKVSEDLIKCQEFNFDVMNYYYI
jgi:hypothetical protein